MRFELTILGSGSALPTSNRNTTAQVLNVLERSFLIDCGEATQHQLRKNKISFNQVNHILISHLHGDHFFGLFGLISSMALVGRQKALHIYGPPQLQNILHTILSPQFEKQPFPLQFHSFNAHETEIIFDDKVLTVQAFPLRHSVPVWGFLFKEKPRLRNIISEKIQTYQISIPEIHHIKAGGNIEREGQVIHNNQLTKDPLPPRSYAFMTDTLITKQYIDLIQNTDILYHEATFLHEDLALARKTMHTTALQAGKLAAEARVKYLLTGHFSTRYKNNERFEIESKKAFSQTIASCDGDQLQWPTNHCTYFTLQRDGKKIKLK